MSCYELYRAVALAPEQKEESVCVVYTYSRHISRLLEVKEEHFLLLSLTSIDSGSQLESFKLLCNNQRSSLR